MFRARCGRVMRGDFFQGGRTPSRQKVSRGEKKARLIHANTQRGEGRNRDTFQSPRRALCVAEP